MSFLSKIFGDANASTIGGYKTIVQNINELEQTFESFSIEELKNKTQELKQKLSNGELLDNLLPEGFALVRESSKRTLGQRHFDVQLMGGIALHRRNIS